MSEEQRREQGITPEDLLRAIGEKQMIIEFLERKLEVYDKALVAAQQEVHDLREAAKKK